MKQTVRTFIAVELSDRVRQQAVALVESLAAAGADVKWVNAENLHLTIKFLDEVALKEIPRVCEAVAWAAAGAAPFELEIRGAGAFPTAARPKTVWLGVGGGEEQMAALFAALEISLAKLGFRKEPRRFVPHLTLGRVRSGGPGVAALGALLQQRADFRAGATRVERLVVFSSELTSQGPIYAPLAHAPLGGK